MDFAINELIPLLLLIICITTCGSIEYYDVFGVYLVNTNTTTVTVQNVLRSNVLCAITVPQRHVTCHNTGRYDLVSLTIDGYIGDSEALYINHIENNEISIHTVRDVINITNQQIDSQMVIYSPTYGALVSNKLEIEIGSIGSVKFDNIYFAAEGVGKLYLQPDTEVIESTNIDVQTGSIFYNINTVKRMKDSATGEVYESSGYPVEGYLEFVLSQEDIRRYRRFRTQSAIPSKTDELNHLSSVFRRDKEKGGPIEVCVFGGPKLDGQKQIWRQQAEHMDPARYHFTWLLHLRPDASVEDQVVTNAVLQHVWAVRDRITIGSNPTFSLALDMLDQDPGGGRGPASAVWVGQTVDLYRYAHESLVAANFSIDRVQPQWCRELYEQMRTTMQKHRCDLVVFGNQAGFGSDVTIVDTAAVLGVPAVNELMNLNLHPLMVPSAVVAPSAFVLEHPSVHKALGANENRSSSNSKVSSAVVALVIPPSVDSDHFDPARYRPVPAEVEQQPPRTPSYQHPSCSVSTSGKGTARDASSPCTVVGFIARLSPEKNPGLFLQMAQRLLQLHPFARFTVVGDGALRTALEDLAARLRISWAVHFTGWVSAEELPVVLAGMDIVVNPGLVLETFCISNIEAMSMGVPLVTFAVGGIGEYVAAPSQLSADDSKDSIDEPPDFSVSSNAVVVHRASPTALAEAALYLVLRPALRRELAAAGRRTVLSNYGIQRQMQQYAQLYDQLFYSTYNK